MILSFLKKHYLTIAIVVFGVFILYRPPVDPDFGWHYKYGEYIFKNHALLKENIFSYTFTDYKWANSYWLSELYLYVVSTVLGMQALALINSIAFSVLVLWLINKSGVSSTFKILCLFPFFATLSIFAITVRPLFFSSIFLLLITYILLYRPKAIKYFPLIFLLWANLHADYVPGLFIYGVYSFIDLLNSFKDKRFNLTKNIFIPLASVFSTFLNPFTISLWTTLLKERNTVMLGNISEFLPISSDAGAAVILLMFIFGGLILSSVIMYRNRKNIWYPVVMVFFFLLSLRFIYFLRVFIIIGIFGFCNCWGYIFDNILRMYKRLTSFRVVVLAKIIFLFCMLFAGIIFVTNFYNSLSVERWSVAAGMPYGAVKYIKENKLQGNMFNNYSWGGYLIWQLPEYKTFIDGRMPSWREHGDFLFKDYISITRDPEKNYALFSKYVKEYNIGWVIDKEDSKLSKFLAKQLEWKVLWKENNTVIFTRNVEDF